MAIYKVQVNHTIKMKKTRVERTRVRHRDETELHQVDEKRQEMEPEKMTRMIIMYQIELTCLEGDQLLGEAQCLVQVPDFPREFPYLIDYMRSAI